jgi:hypothetical protein
LAESVAAAKLQPIVRLDDIPALASRLLDHDMSIRDAWPIPGSGNSDPGVRRMHASVAYGAVHDVDSRRARSGG